MIDHILTDLNRSDDGAPSTLTRQGHLWIRNEMLDTAKLVKPLLYEAATNLEHQAPQQWGPAQIADLRRGARLVDEMAIRLWLSSLFGVSYEME